MRYPQPQPHYATKELELKPHENLKSVPVLGQMDDHHQRIGRNDKTQSGSETKSNEIAYNAVRY